MRDEDGERLPAALDRLMREAMAAFDSDPSRAEFLFHFGLSQAPAELALYRVLYKFHNRKRRFEAAFDYARRGLLEATRQAGLAESVLDWRREQLHGVDAETASHALHALKALGFLSLRLGRPEDARHYLDLLAELDPEDGVGGSVVRALLAGVAA